MFSLTLLSSSSACISLSLFSFWWSWFPVSRWHWFPLAFLSSSLPGNHQSVSLSIETNLCLLDDSPGIVSWFESTLSFSSVALFNSLHITVIGMICRRNHLLFRPFPSFPSFSGAFIPSFLVLLSSVFLSWLIVSRSSSLSFALYCPFTDVARDLSFCTSLMPFFLAHLLYSFYRLYISLALMFVHMMSGLLHSKSVLRLLSSRFLRFLWMWVSVSSLVQWDH